MKDGREREGEIEIERENRESERQREERESERDRERMNVFKTLGNLQAGIFKGDRYVTGIAIFLFNPNSKLPTLSN